MRQATYRTTLRSVSCCNLAFIAFVYCLSPYSDACDHRRTALNERMQQVVTVDFTSTPLVDIIQQLGDVLGVHFQVDHQELQAWRIDPNAELSFSATQLRASSLLDLLLSPLDLGWAPQGGSILITSQKVLEDLYYVRIYPVKHLLGKPTDYTPFDSLIIILISTVAPSVWETVHNEAVGFVFGDEPFLAVRQTNCVHREIDELFSQLETIASKDPHYPRDHCTRN